MHASSCCSSFQKAPSSGAQDLLLGRQGDCEVVISTDLVKFKLLVVKAIICTKSRSNFTITILFSNNLSITKG